jgi:hypothetical protein
MPLVAPDLDSAGPGYTAHRDGGKDIADLEKVETTGEAEKRSNGAVRLLVLWQG